MELGVHVLLESLLHLSEAFCLSQFFDEFSIYGNVGNSDLNNFAVEIDAKVATLKELEGETSEPLACLDEISRVHEQMEAQQVTVQQTLQ